MRTEYSLFAREPRRCFPVAAPGYQPLGPSLYLRDVAHAGHSVPSQASSALARVSFMAAVSGVLLVGAGWLLIAWAGADLAVAWLVFSSVVLAFCAFAVGALQGLRAARQATRQQQPRVLGLAAAALSFTFLALLSPLLLWSLLFFVCDCVSP